MHEFLTGLSSGPAWLWGLFVLGAMAAAALSLSAFWAALFRAAAWLRPRFPSGRRRVDRPD